MLDHVFFSPCHAMHTLVCFTRVHSSFPFFRGAEEIEDQLEFVLEEVVKRNLAVDFIIHRYLNLRDCG